MNTILVLAPTVSPYLSVTFPDGTGPLDRAIAAVETLRSTMGDRTVVTVVAGADVATLVPDSWRQSTVQDGSAAGMLRAADQTLPADAESVVVMSLDAPFPDLRLARYLLRLHTAAWCDYTFADGFPRGYAPEVLRRGVIETMAALAEAHGTSWTATVLFDVLSLDINAFDIETEAAEEDFSLLRLSLTVDTRADYTLCRRLVERGVAPDPAAPPTDPPDPLTDRYPHRDIPVLAALREPAIRRTLPSYYQVQVTTEMAQRPTYQPWSDARWQPAEPTAGLYMGLERWNALLAAVSAFSPEATIAIGYRGEPALHPQIDQLITAAAGYPGIELYVETSGIGWTERARRALESPVVRAVIVELDATDAERYRDLRGEGFEEAEAFILSLADTVPGRVYAQATRMVENEWELQEFFRRWDAQEGVHPLIQKYNSWAGRLPDRRVADMTPLNRHPCWHLQRDLVVQVDGTVPRCFQDLDGEATRGNLFEDGLAVVWDAGAADYSAHGRGEYPGICASCDEYYTFNA